MDPSGTIEMYITDQSSIISPSSEDTFLQTFGNIISNEINTINGEDKICIISSFFFVELLNNDKRHFMPVVSGSHSSLFPGQRMCIAIWSNDEMIV